MPFFSIVIPTKNRSHLLRSALASCRAQTCQDFEVIVSDNNSSDGTREVVAESGDGRVRGVSTGRDVSPADNFEFGVSHASGEYVLLMADDEAHPPYALAKLRGAVDATGATVVSFGRIPYAIPAQGQSGNYLDVRPFSRNVSWVPSRLALSHLFSLSNFREHYFARALPLSVKSMVHRSIVERIRRRTGRFQLGPSPDWSSCTMILALVKQVLLIDEHLLISGVGHADQLGPVLQRTREWDPLMAREWEAVQGFVPVRALTFHNSIIASFLAAQRAVGPLLDGYEIDRAVYLTIVFRELLALQRHGVDVASDLAEVARVAERESVTLPQAPAVRRQALLRRVAGRTARGARSMLRGGQVPKSWPGRFHGKEWGFSNILECAAQYSKLSATISRDERALTLYQAAYGSCERVSIDWGDDAGFDVR